MPISLIHSPILSDIAEYAYAATVDTPARLIYTAGACPLDAEGNTVAVGDYAGQARQAMLNLRTALGDAGAGLPDVVKSTVYVASANQSDLVTAWETVREFFDAAPGASIAAPSTLLGVTVLGYDHQLVEIEAVAAISESRR